MNIRVLEQLVALARHLHFGRASESTNVSASALSRNLAQLEKTLGVRLFERDNRHVEITPAGQKVESWARETLEGWSALRGALTTSATTLAGEIRLYCSVTASYGLLTDLLGRLESAHPGIEIKLHTGDPEHAIARIRAGEEEVGIAARPDTLPRGLAFRRLADSPLVFIAAHDEEQGGKISDTAHALTAPMILPESGLARRRVDAWYKACGTPPKVHTEVTGNEAIVAMVALGLGAGVVPRIVLDNSPLARKVRELNVSPALAPYEIGLVTLERRLKDPLIDAFWSLAHAK